MVEYGIMCVEVISMFKINPYRPGAGQMPTYLAGRDEDIAKVEKMFEALTLGVPSQSVIFSGLRGVGKTVLINKLQKIAEGKGVFCKHIEVETRNDFISQIAACSQAFLREVNSKEKVKHLVKRALDAIKSLVISFNPEDNTFSLSVQERELYQSNNLTQSLTDVFTLMGEAAQETETPICFFIDEIQYMKKNELGALIASLHRTNQLGYPVMIVGAGLPKIYKMLSDEKTYSERLFSYQEIGSLNYEQAKSAILEPVKKFDMEYTEDAVDKIIEITKGYPYFIQQFCNIVYDEAEDKQINSKLIEKVTSLFFETLDSGFFKVRYERCSDMDKRFIFAMVKCGKLPCTISNISRYFGRNGKAISPTRAQLINKGIIYPVKYGELDFTVPEFSGFIRRLDEYNEWKNK